jgi:uncharacterized protein (DUF2235 family)
MNQPPTDEEVDAAVKALIIADQAMTEKYPRWMKNQAKKEKKAKQRALLKQTDCD